MRGMEQGLLPAHIWGAGWCMQIVAGLKPAVFCKLKICLRTEHVQLLQVAARSVTTSVSISLAEGHVPRLQNKSELQEARNMMPGMEGT